MDRGEKGKRRKEKMKSGMGEKEKGSNRELKEEGHWGGRK